MSIYSQLVSDFIIIDNTAVKNTIINLFADSDYNSLSDFVEHLILKCGVSSMNIMLVRGDKWDVYMDYSDGNIFSKPKGIFQLVDKPVTRDQAEHILASKVTHLLETVDFETFETRLYSKCTKTA